MQKVGALVSFQPTLITTMQHVRLWLICAVCIVTPGSVWAVESCIILFLWCHFLFTSSDNNLL